MARPAVSKETSETTTSALPSHLPVARYALESGLFCSSRANWEQGRNKFPMIEIGG